jgi:CrcB protein
MSEVIEVLAVAAGAVPGALSRYKITEWTKASFGLRFPYGTFLINLTGCLAMGFFVTLFQKIPNYPHSLDLLIRTGFLGAYTTFSTYGLDLLILWRSKQFFLTLFFGVGSMIFGLIAVILGIKIAEFFLA